MLASREAILNLDRRESSMRLVWLERELLQEGKFHLCSRHLVFRVAAPQLSHLVLRIIPEHKATSRTAQKVADAMRVRMTYLRRVLATTTLRVYRF